MFPFYRKHTSGHVSGKNSVRRNFGARESEEYEMTDEEYSRYIKNNDNSKHQTTRGAHDRYCNKILRDKEEVLLSSLNPRCGDGTPTNSVRLGPDNYNMFAFPMGQSNRESVSLPSSPRSNRNFLDIAPVNRRKSETLTNADDDLEQYILTLKIDDVSANIEDVSFFRIGPRQSESSPMEESGQDCFTIQFQEMDEVIGNKLRKLIFGMEKSHVPKYWARQCFSFCHIAASRWRLIQMKPGCCGVVAAVEAFLIKSLIFDPGYCKLKDPLRPNQKEVVDAFIHALSYILWQAGDFRRAVVVIPDSMEQSINLDSFSFLYVEYTNFDQLRESIAANMKYFICTPNHGYVNFIISVILSRGIDNVLADMDEDVPLITENGHCSLELVMLLITGKATSNVFDNDIQIDLCFTLKGVKREVDIGLLSLYEHLNACEVGKYLKSPKFPIWLVNYSDHFTVLFSSQLEYTRSDVQQPFVLYHYDSMTAFSCETDIKLVIDPCVEFPNEHLHSEQTSLQLCVRTKWKNAVVIYEENTDILMV